MATFFMRRNTPVADAVTKLTRALQVVIKDPAFLCQDERPGAEIMPAGIARLR